MKKEIYNDKKEITRILLMLLGTILLVVSSILNSVVLFGVIGCLMALTPILLVK